MRDSHHPEGKIPGCGVMREVGMGLDQSSSKSALVINNVALFVALVGGYHQLSWIISGNSIPNTATAGKQTAVMNPAACSVDLGCEGHHIPWYISPTLNFIIVTKYAEIA